VLLFFYFQLHDFSGEEILITGDNWCPVNSRRLDKQVGLMLNADRTGLKENQVLTLALRKSVITMKQIGGISSKKRLIPPKVALVVTG